jgi:hypothetical protein
MRRSSLVLVAALVVAGCGDDDGGAAATTTATVAPADVDFCDAFGALLVGPLAEGGFDPGDPAALEEAVAVTRAIVDALRSSAPAAVTDAAAAVATAYDGAFAVLDRYGYDLARVDAEATPQEQAVLDDFGRPPAGPGSTDPYEQVESFVAERCAPGVTVPDLDTTTTTP